VLLFLSIYATTSSIYLYVKQASLDHMAQWVKGGELAVLASEEVSVALGRIFQDAPERDELILRRYISIFDSH
jgi:hypothetical protein